MPSGQKELHRLTAFANLAALIAVAAGLLGLAGFALHIGLLTGTGQSLAPLQPATAIGLLCCGVALRTLLRGQEFLLPRLLGIAGIGIGAARVAPWLFSWSIPDVSLPILIKQLLPSRIAPMAGAGLLATGLALVSLSSAPSYRLRPVLAGTLAAIVAAVGLATFCGYLSGLSLTYADGHPMHMALLGAVAFAALGGGLFFLAWRDGSAQWPVQRWVPLPVGVGAAVIALVLWGAMRAWEENELHLRQTEAANSVRLTVGEGRSTLPQVTLVAGMLMAFLLALAAHLAQTARVRAREAETAEREIKAEINQRLRVEEELNQSEARFRQLVEHAADAIFVYGADGQFVEVNQRACESLGYSRAELLRLTLADIESASFDPIAGCAREQHYARGLPVSAEGVHRRRDGSTFPVEVRVSAVRWDGRPVMLAIARDVTGRRQAEEELREQKALLQHILEHIPCAVFWKDRNSVYMGGNELCARNFGLHSATDLAGKSDRDLCRDPEEAEFYIHCDREVMDTGWPMLNIEETQLRPDGRREVLLTSKVPLRNTSGEVIGLLGIYTDISGRKRSEEALRLSEGRYRSLVEGSLQGVVIHRGGKVLFANRAVAGILGYDRPADLTGIDVDTFIPSEERGRMRRRRDALLRGESVEPYVEWQALARDDSRIWVHSSLTTIPWDGETALASFWINITERKRLEERFLQAQRMEAVGQLAGGIAHDFNNLLTVINGFAELVLADLGLDHPAANMVREVRKAGERAAGLTRQLLAYGRKTILMPKVIDLSATIQSTAPLVRSLLPEDIELQLDLATDIGPILADPGQLEQVLINLVINARDAMPHGGRVTIGTAEATIGKEVLPGGPDDPQPGPYRRLTVADTGMGMDEATRARAFEPFFTTKEPGKGTGLGLAMVYGIIKASGGHVIIESAPGRGSAISIYLPPAPIELPTSESAFRAPTIESGRETVLVVEDEEGVCFVTRLALQTAGYRVLVASDGIDALELCDKHMEPIDLLLTDIVMPRLGGPGLAEELARRRPGLKVLFMSGHAHGYRLPAEAPFLHKPFTPSALTAKVREVLDAIGSGAAKSASPAG